jgi:hypothetical protein
MKKEQAVGRKVLRKSRPVGGVKGHNMKQDDLTGKPRPVAGELHILPYPRENPSFYGGDELHKAKEDKVQNLIEKWGLDGLLFLRSEVVRYITDFFVKGYRPFFELEYFVLIPKGKKPSVGYSSGSDNYRIQLRSSIEDYRKLSGFGEMASGDGRDAEGLRADPGPDRDRHPPLFHE